jgi:hypothetical protein
MSRSGNKRPEEPRKIDFRCPAEVCICGRRGGKFLASYYSPELPDPRAVLVLVCPNNKSVKLCFDREGQLLKESEPTPLP